ncbi:MAG: hypothetical protein JF589_15555 [Gemmatimonadetes bacterium]|nr:hypothetical protein [Gemmatimonadota bacterium]
MTDRTRLALCCAVALIACGGDSTARPLQTDAAAVAQTFSQLADSVARNGGNTEVGTAYGSIAGILRMGGRITPITLTIDGASRSFLATAMSIESVTNPCPPNAQCFAPEMRIVQRSLIAWDRDNPTHIVQLSSSSDDERIGSIRDSTSLALWAPTASLIYMDGTGIMYFGTSGAQRFTVTKSTTACPEPDYFPPLGVLRPRGYSATCVLADIAVKFDGTVEPSVYVAANKTAVTHTIAMGAQTVAGTHQETSVTACDTTCSVPPTDPNGPTPTPPVVVQPGTDLPASLTASVDSLVHLVFTVKNPSGGPIRITFPSSQRFDIVAIDSTSGKNVWTWSANQTFLGAIQDETVPGNGALVYTASWKPSAKGLYLFHAMLASKTPRAEAYTTVIVP